MLKSVKKIEIAFRAPKRNLTYEMLPLSLEMSGFSGLFCQPFDIVRDPFAASQVA